MLLWYAWTANLLCHCRLPCSTCVSCVLQPQAFWSINCKLHAACIFNILYSYNTLCNSTSKLYNAKVVLNFQFLRKSSSPLQSSNCIQPIEKRPKFAFQTWRVFTTETVTYYNIIIFKWGHKYCILWNHHPSHCKEIFTLYKYVVYLRDVSWIISKLVSNLLYITNSYYA